MNLKSIAALEIILRVRDEASRAFQSVDKAAGGLGGTVGRIAGGALKVGAAAVVGVGAAAAGTGAALLKMASDAAPIQGIRASFESLNADAGKTLKTLREGSLGMIGDADLMRNYNEAVQLVGKSFADDLPGAMQYLSKVSASTGKDMGFLMDSLTTGVGRLSPMILDNLGIQVDLVSANEAYAASIGKTAAELTEAEQKSALMAQVLDKLRENTAVLPDVTGNAATSMAQLQAQLQNAKDGIGEALLPALSALLQPLAELAQKYGPQVVVWAQQAGAWLGENIPKALAWLSETWQKVWPQVQAALQTAWGVIQPILQTVQGWFNNDGPGALDKLREVAGAALGAVKGFVEERLGWVIDWFRENWPLIKETGETILNALRTAVETALAAVKAFWEEHGERIMAYIDNMWTVISTIFDTTLKTILDLVKSVMQLITGDTEGFKATMEGIWTRLKEAGATIFGALKENLLLLWNGLLDAVRQAWDGFVGWISGVGENIVNAIRSGIEGAWEGFKGWLKGKLEDLVGGVLDTLGIHSDSAVFVGIGQNLMHALQTGIDGAAHLPAVALRGVVTDLVGVPVGVGASGFAGGGLVINQYFGRDAVRSDDDIERIAQRIEDVLALRGAREPW